MCIRDRVWHHVRVEDLTAPVLVQRVCLVIPGAGHHSQDHHAILKPAVEQWLRTQGYSFEVHDAGSFDVKV